MKNKKGFTLVELLAIIVILAIISVIAVPIVMNIMENARKKAFEDKVLAAYKKIDDYVLENEYKNDDIEVIKLDKGFKSGKFLEISGNTKAEFITDGTYCARGKVTNLKISKGCYKLDDTEASIDDTKIVITSTTNSITVGIAEGFASDLESDIKEYQVTIKGNGIEETKTSKNIGPVRFTGLKNETTYTFEIDVINGNDIGLKNKIIKQGTTKKIDAPTFAVSPEGWSQNKTVTIDYKDPENKYTHEYSLDDGKTWASYESAITLNENGNVVARVFDGTNYVTASSEAITTIDTTPPTCELVVDKITANKTVKLKANCSDGTGSGVANYTFSNGTNWTDKELTNTITYNSYKLSKMKAKVKDAVNNETEVQISESLRNEIYIDIIEEFEDNSFMISHPVGSIYVTTNTNENTVAKMEAKYGGEWAVFAENRVLRSTTGTAEQPGGSNTATLITANLPEHDHSIPSLSGTAASTGSGYTLTYNTATANNATSSANDKGHTHSIPSLSGTAASAGGHAHTLSGASTGSAGSHTHDFHGYSGAKILAVDTSSTLIAYADGFAVNTTGWYAGSNKNNGAIASGGAHSHTISGTLTSNGAHTHTVTTTASTSDAESQKHTHTYTNKYVSELSGVEAHTHTVTTTASTTGKTGSGTSFSVLDPYITVYMFKRTK